MTTSRSISRGGYRIPCRRGYQLLEVWGRGYKHSNLPDFPKNCMKLRTFWSVGRWPPGSVADFYIIWSNDPVPSKTILPLLELIYQAYYTHVHAKATKLSYVTRSPKYGYQWPHKKYVYYPNIFFTKKWCLKFISFWFCLRKGPEGPAEYELCPNEGKG